MPLEIAGIGLTAALAAGVVSFVSLCVLPLVPGYVSYIAGQSLDYIAYETAWRARLATVGLSFSFMLGFSSVFVALGATVVRQLLQAIRYEASYAAESLIIVFGLHMMGILRFGLLNRDSRYAGKVRGGRSAGAFVLGTAFA